MNTTTMEVTMTVDGVDTDTGEVVAYLGGPFTDDPAEVRVPIERLLGWKDARRGEPA